MSQLDRIRESAPDICDQASAALDAQGEAIETFNEAKKAYGESAAAAGKVACEVLSVVCNDATIPMIERAGWSTAFHLNRRTLTSLDDFATKASEYQSRLEAIDSALREPGVPILAVNPGPLGDHSRGSSLVMRYAVRRGNGTGLDIHQAWNEGQKWHYHWANAAEEEYQEGRSMQRGFANNSSSDDLLSNMTTETLLAVCVDPAKAASIIREESYSNIGHLYLIGESAITAVLNSDSAYNMKFDALRGAVTLAGVNL